MSDAWRVASIKSFEQVPVAATTSLLRVSARSAFRAQPDDARPTLYADDGQTVSHFAAVPAPPDSGGMLRVAYSVPAEVVTTATVFSLEFEDGFVIALPEPQPGPARLNRRVASAPPPTSPSPATPPFPAAAVPDVAPGASVTAAPAGAPVPVATPEAPDGERRSELQQKITELTEELGQARVENAELREAAGGAQQARDAILRLHCDNAVAYAELTAARALARHAEAPSDDDDEGRADLRRQLQDAQDQLHRMSLERDELSRQAEASEAVAVKARERAAEAEDDYQKANGRLSELEVWSAELERRLAETTTQLADVRSQLERHDAPAARAVPAPGQARSVSDSQLDQIRWAATAEAHEQAERDLADATSGRF